MNLAPYDYYSDQPCNRRGLCLTAMLIEQARHEADGAILLDNGDFLQGSPLGDYVAAEGVQTGAKPHPMIHAMNLLGYDAVNIGNHEFSHGVDFLAASLADATFRVLSANTMPSNGSAIGQHIRPWAIIDRTLTDAEGGRHHVRVGVIGVLPPQTEVWDKQAIKGQVSMLPLVETVALYVPHLRRAGADVVVVLAHCGIGGVDDDDSDHSGALAAAQIEGVDAVIMGHVHRVFPAKDAPDISGVDRKAGTLAGKPAVMPGHYGSHLGVIDLVLQAMPEGWQVKSYKAEVRPLHDLDRAMRAWDAADGELARSIRRVHDETRIWIRKPIGHTPRPIHSFFAMMTDCPTVQIVNKAQAAHVTARLAGGPYEALPVLSVTAPFRAGGLSGPDNYTLIPPGDLLLRHVADLYVQTNTIMALRMTGAELLTWMEHSVRGYHRVEAGKADQPLLRNDVPSFLYDTVFGLTYQIDLSQPTVEQGGRRIVDLRWNGLPMNPDQSFIVATNSYRGSGTGSYVPSDPARVVLAEQTSIRDILIDHLSHNEAALAAPFAPAWRFCPMPDTSVTVDTSPLASAYLQDAPSLRIEPIGETGRGFLRLRLAL
jgi:2',3'-cyclic-nucleotide 2'-phosphodiesterase / 3'-nucleotidase